MPPGRLPSRLIPTMRIIPEAVWIDLGGLAGPSPLVDVDPPSVIFDMKQFLIIGCAVFMGCYDITIVPAPHRDSGCAGVGGTGGQEATSSVSSSSVGSSGGFGGGSPGTTSSVSGTGGFGGWSSGSTSSSSSSGAGGMEPDAGECTTILCPTVCCDADKMNCIGNQPWVYCCPEGWTCLP